MHQFVLRSSASPRRGALAATRRAVDFIGEEKRLSNSCARRRELSSHHGRTVICILGLPTGTASKTSLAKRVMSTGGPLLHLELFRKCTRYGRKTAWYQQWRGARRNLRLVLRRDQAEHRQS